MSAESAAQRAEAHLRAGEYRQAREAAIAGMAQAPDDVELLILAGRAGVELDAEDATGQLQRATELARENADAWHYLGEALATEGRMDEAGDAFRRAVELNPADQVALSHLGHTSAATGNREEAVGYLSQAAQSMGRASTASISLVDMYRTLGQYEEALAQARLIAEAEPDELLGVLDVAELSLEVGQLDEALAAFARLRELDDVPGHESYPLHGMIKVELRRDNPQRALGLAREAASADQQGRSVGIVAFLEAQTGADEAAAADAADGEGAEEESPTREEVDGALDASLSEYRRMHADDRRLSSEDILG
jgi:tetratricopeptide (TPR) repeat protein